MLHFGDSTESVTHDENKNYKYQKNCHIPEFTAKVVLLWESYSEVTTIKQIIIMT